MTFFVPDLPECDFYDTFAANVLSGTELWQFRTQISKNRTENILGRNFKSFYWTLLAIPVPARATSTCKLFVRID